MEMSQFGGPVVSREEYEQGILEAVTQVLDALGAGGRLMARKKRIEALYQNVENN